MFETAGQSELSGGRAVDWSALALEAPVGLAVVDCEGRFVQVNAVAATLCGLGEADLIGSLAPFPLQSCPGGRPDGLGALQDDQDERFSTWVPADGPDREFAFRARPVSGGRGLTIIAFRDVTAERHRRRLALHLHDSIVQQVFSIRMQAKSMDILGEQGGTVSAEALRRFANEVGALSGAVLADLRAIAGEPPGTPAWRRADGRSEGTS
jgi:PAS domain S-box-containing protein